MGEQSASAVLREVIERARNAFDDQRDLSALRVMIEAAVHLEYVQAAETARFEAMAAQQQWESLPQDIRERRFVLSGEGQ